MPSKDKKKKEEKERMKNRHRQEQIASVAFVREEPDKQGNQFKQPGGIASERAAMQVQKLKSPAIT